MRLAEEAYTSRPWRIHEIAPDFRVEDVWELPVTGGPDDFEGLIEGFANSGSEQSSPVNRALFAIRIRLGELFGWDDDEDGLESRVAPLRDRLPEDLQDAAPGPGLEGLPFQPLYLTDNEFATEIANKTVHAVMHIGWVPEGDGVYRGRMTVLVKPNGLGGEAYMAAIKPFRHWLVYPAMLRGFERRARPKGVGDVTEIELPAGARELSTLALVDYTDSFLLDTSAAPDRTPEEWARAMIAESPTRSRVTLPLGWRALGLRHGWPGSGDGVLGWEIRESNAGYALLGADSWFGMPAELLFRREPDGLLFATFVEHDNAAVRLLWSRISEHHRNVVRELLRRAGRAG